MGWVGMAHASWWLDLETRDAFEDAVKREETRIRRGTTKPIIYTVGWDAPKKKKIEVSE